MLVTRLGVLPTRRELGVGLVRVEELLLLELGTVDLDGHRHGTVTSILRTRLTLALCIKRRQVFSMLQRGLLNVLRRLLMLTILKHRSSILVILLSIAHHCSLLVLLCRNIIFGNMPFLSLLLLSTN